MKQKKPRSIIIKKIKVKKRKEKKEQRLFPSLPLPPLYRLFPCLSARYFCFYSSFFLNFKSIWWISKNSLEWCRIWYSPSKIRFSFNLLESSQCLYSSFSDFPRSMIDRLKREMPDSPQTKTRICFPGNFPWTIYSFWSDEWEPSQFSLNHRITPPISIPISHPTLLLWKCQVLALIFFCLSRWVTLPIVNSFPFLLLSSFFLLP